MSKTDSSRSFKAYVEHCAAARQAAIVCVRDTFDELADAYARNVEATLGDFGGVIPADEIAGLREYAFRRPATVDVANDPELSGDDADALTETMAA